MASGTAAVGAAASGPEAAANTGAGGVAAATVAGNGPLTTGNRAAAGGGEGFPGVTASAGDSATIAAPAAGEADENPGRLPLGDGAAWRGRCCSCCSEAGAGVGVGADAAVVLMALTLVFVPSWAPSMKPHHMKTVGLEAPTTKLKAPAPTGGYGFHRTKRT